MNPFCITTTKCRNNNKHNRIDQIWAVEVDIICISFKIVKTNDWRVIITHD